jgi:hypothetical protein
VDRGERGADHRRRVRRDVAAVVARPGLSRGPVRRSGLAAVGIERHIGLA